MAAAEVQRERQLVVRELPRHKGGFIRQGVQVGLQTAGIVAPEFQATTPREITIPRDVKGKVGLRGRKERKLVAQAMQDLAMGSDQGTKVRPGRFTVADQFVINDIPQRE